MAEERESSLEHPGRLLRPRRESRHIFSRSASEVARKAPIGVQPVCCRVHSAPNGLRIALHGPNRHETDPGGRTKRPHRNVATAMESGLGRTDKEDS